MKIERIKTLQKSKDDLIKTLQEDNVSQYVFYSIIGDDEDVSGGKKATVSTYTNYNCTNRKEAIGLAELLKVKIIQDLLVPPDQEDEEE